MDKFALSIEEGLHIGHTLLLPTSMRSKCYFCRISHFIYIISGALINSSAFCKKRLKQSRSKCKQGGQKPSRNVLQKYAQLENIGKLKKSYQQKKNQTASVLENKRA